MKLAIYTPAEAIMRKPEVLDRLISEHKVESIILRSADPHAFDIVKNRGLQALWLAPGLWGNVVVPMERQAQFLSIPGWMNDPSQTYEGRWKMYCPTDQLLVNEMAENYAEIVKQTNADGIYCTHMRFHHPSDIEQLWGCTCSRCQLDMSKYNLSMEELQSFWLRLSRTITSDSISSWDRVELDKANIHPLIAWWSSVTESDFPVRWFQWKNATVKQCLSGLAQEYQNKTPGSFFATNSFEPILAPLVGHHPDSLARSEWYSPLLGYWSIHLWQSVVNLSMWHGRLANSTDIPSIIASFERILGLEGIISNPIRALEQELVQGAAIAAHLNRPYWPVINGTCQPSVPLNIALKQAEESGANGVVLQGISQLMGDPDLDFWV